MGTKSVADRPAGLITAAPRRVVIAIANFASLIVEANLRAQGRTAEPHALIIVIALWTSPEMRRGAGGGSGKAEADPKLTRLSITTIPLIGVVAIAGRALGEDVEDAFPLRAISEGTGARPTQTQLATGSV